MKGLQGLIVAGLLGLLAVALNWVYLQQKTADVEKVMFLGVKEGFDISPPDKLTKEHLEAVPIPERHAGNLKDYVFLYKDLKTVVGVAPARTVRGGELLPRSIYTTPPAKLNLQPDERQHVVAVSSQSFVPDLVNPGDEITFIVPKLKTRAPATLPPPADAGALRPEPDANATTTSAGVEYLGPFTICSVGNRLGSRGALAASRKSQTQDRLIGVVIKVEGDGLDRQSTKLVEYTTKNGTRNIGILLHPPKK